jgi:hypothetical protein
VIVANESHQGAIHMQIATIGLDIAKNVFQFHGIDAAEKVIVNALGAGLVEARSASAMGGLRAYLDSKLNASQL